jgi:hypothetical protein
MKNKTTFIREKVKTNYTCISNKIIQSTKLKSEEKDILNYLLSLPDDWIIYKSQIQTRYRETLSIHKFDKGWSGLKDKGYIKAKPEQGTNGKFNSWRYEVRENPITDILVSEMSEIQEVENPTSPNLMDKQSTNRQSTNKQNTELENTDTSIILEENKINPIKIDKKRLSNNEIARNLNFEGLDKLLKDSGLNWLQDITSIPVEEFISKYHSYSGDSDDYRLRFLVTSYFELNNKITSNPKGESMDFNTRIS